MSIKLESIYTTVNAYLRTDEFKSFCESDVGEFYCAGHTNGVTDTLLILSYIRQKEVGKPYLCLPKQFSVEQVTDIALKYINAHPEGWHKPARVSVLSAVMNAFKCQE